MPEYHFKAKDGERIVIEAEMSKAPGSQLTRQGKVFKRCYDLSQVVVRESATPGRVGSRSLPKRWPFHNRYDSEGRCLFENQRERDEAHAKAAHEGEMLTKADLSRSGQKQGMFVDD